MNILFKIITLGNIYSNLMPSLKMFLIFFPSLPEDYFVFIWTTQDDTYLCYNPESAQMFLDRDVFPILWHLGIK